MMAKPRNDFDTPWKEILNGYFPLFVQYFYPQIAKDINWSRGYTSLDKELARIAPNAKFGNRKVDMLFRVWLLNGKEIWVLFHIEIQGQKDSRFELRMFVYHYRIFDRYGVQIVSLAILTDNNPHWRPNSYQHNAWGCKLDFQFHLIKLLDYEDRYEKFINSDNIIEIIIAIHLSTVKCQHQPQQTYTTKISLMRSLYRNGFDGTDIRNLYAFIDWCIKLPEPLAIQYTKEIFRLEEQLEVAYITTAERMGFKRGIQEGLQKGKQEGIQQGMQKGKQEGIQEGIEKGELLLLQRQLARKFGKISTHYCQQLQRSSAEELLKLADRILDAKNLDDVFS